MTEPQRSTAPRVSIVFTPSDPANPRPPSRSSITASSSSPPGTSSSSSSPPLAAATLTPAAPGHHRRLSSALRRAPRPARRPSQLNQPVTANRSSFDEHKQAEGNDEPSDDPFASYLTHNAPPGAGHSSKASMGGLLGFTASLAMRRVAMVAKILSSLKRCPLVNPAHITPRSKPASTSLQSPRRSPSQGTSHTASGYPTTFLPHLQLLAHHPSLTVLPYPASSILTHQSSSPSLIHLLISGTIRVIREGVELAHIGRGAVVGAEVCVFSTEGYRRHRRSMWRKRLLQKRQDEADGIDKRRPFTAEEVREAERDRAMDEDERELAFDAELRRGKKRRKLRTAQFCTVQCITPCEFVVFPSSVLRDYLESDSGLRRHSYRLLMEWHWVRRRQWREGDQRLHRVWGPGGLHVDAEDRTVDNARDQADLAALTGNDDIEVEAGALDRAVLGSSSFLVQDIVQPHDLEDEELKRHATHAQNCTLRHPLYSRNGDGVDGKRLRLRSRDDLGGERQQKMEMRKAKEKEDKAKKVRKIIGVMERSRRDSTKQPRGTPKHAEGQADEEEEEEEDEEEDEDEYEKDEDEEAANVEPALFDARYAAAIAAAQVRGTGSGKSSKLSTPKFKLSRRLKDDEVRAVDDKLLGRAAIKGVLSASHRRESTTVDMSLLNFTPHTAARRMVAREEAQSEEEWERLVERQAQEMREQWRRQDEEKAQRRLGSPYVDIHFLRPATAPAATSSSQPQTGEKEGPRRTLASGGFTTRKEVISESAARTREREAEEAAQCAVEQLRADRKLPNSLRSAAVASKLSASVTLGLTARLTADAEQRWVRPDREIRRMADWNIDSHLFAHGDEAEQKVQATMGRQRAEEAEWLSDEEADTANSRGTMRSELVATDELVIDADAELADGAERPILLSPQSKVTTPFAALPPKPLFFPLPPASVREQSAQQSHSARPATAPSQLASQPRFTFSPQQTQQACATARATFGPAAAPTNPRVRQVVTARQLRASAAVESSIDSAMRHVDNRALPWETRLAMLTEAGGMQAAEADRRREARELQSDRDRIAAAMKATVRTSRVAVPFVASGGVRVVERSGGGGERPTSRAGEARGVMKRYTASLSYALCDRM